MHLGPSWTVPMIEFPADVNSVLLLKRRIHHINTTAFPSKKLFELRKTFSTWVENVGSDREPKSGE